MCVMFGMSALPVEITALCNADIVPVTAQEAWSPFPSLYLAVYCTSTAQEARLKGSRCVKKATTLLLLLSYLHRRRSVSPESGVYRILIPVYPESHVELTLNHGPECFSSSTFVGTNVNSSWIMATRMLQFIHSHRYENSPLARGLIINSYPG